MSVTAATVGGKRRHLDPNMVVALLAVGLVLATVLGIWLVFRFVAEEQQRDLRAWQTRLGIVADSRLAAVDGWIESQFGTIRELSENASLQLYVTELTLARQQGAARVEDRAEVDYLRNLLTATAERAGFKAPTLGANVPANVSRVGLAGIALVDVAAAPIVATQDMPPLTDAARAAVRRALGGERALVDLYEGAAGDPTLGFVLPVLAIQADQGAAPIGAVIGIKPVAEELYPLLKQPGSTERTAEALLLRSTAGAVQFLSPQGDGGAALKRSLALDTPDLAEGFALHTPGGFAIRRDYRDNEVLVVSRAIEAAPWTLLYKIDTAEALSESRTRQTRLLTVFLLIIAAVAAAIVAVWRHGTSRRATEAAERYRELADRFAEQRDFLHLVTDSQPNRIMIVDGDNRYRWANRPEWTAAGLAREDLIGKTLASVIGPVEAARFAEVNRGVLASRQNAVVTHRFDRDGRSEVIQSAHIFLDRFGDMSAGVLMVLEDITAAVVEREKRERIMRQVVETLVKVIDRRDPFSANHSGRVLDVAGSIVEEMQLDAATLETAQFAASLMNLGKIFVPERILTKEGSLSDEEMAQVRSALQSGPELLEGVEFPGPVVESLRQLNENWDGSGNPRGLKGDEILAPARIVQVANAFVGMVSARAYRAGMEFDAAIAILQRESGQRFDRRVVTALANILDNRDGRRRWAPFGATPAA